MSDESGKTHVSIVICGHVDRRAVLHRSSRARPWWRRRRFRAIGVLSKAERVV